MNERLLQIFNAYKSSEYYTSNVEADLEWLRDKLNEEDFDEIEKQIYTIMLENEEETFINGFKYAWGLFRELENSDNLFWDTNNQEG